MDRTEISEVLFGAVDTIISARMKNLAYDITKTCTIIDNSLRSKGKYTVSDGSVTFEANSRDKTLKINDNVMVTIPNGDYSQNKVIITKIEPDNLDNVEYTSQLDLMQIFTDNIIDGYTSKTIDNIGLLANDSGSSSYIGPLYEISNRNGDLSGYTRLGISAGFQSLLGAADVTKGEYGLKLYIYSNIPTAPGVRDTTGVYEFTFSSKEMLGDPYKFDYFFTQEKVIDISSIDNINKIEIFFYQNGAFENSQGDKIDWQQISYIPGLPSAKLPNNLFVNNIKLFLGYESDLYKEDDLKITCEEETTYNYINYNINTGTGPSKHLHLKWLHKFTDGTETNSKFELLNQSHLRDMDIQLKWFRYNLNAKNIDQFAGRGWEEIRPDANNIFDCSIIPDINLAEEKIKVIAKKIEITYEGVSKLANNAEYLEAWNQLMEQRSEELAFKSSLQGRINELLAKEELTSEEQTELESKQQQLSQIKTDEEFNTDLENLKKEYLESIESVITYESEPIILTNEVKVYDSITFNATSALSIHYEDGSEGNYYIYDTNGRILNQGKGQGFERKMRAVYNGKEITPGLGNLDYIAWYLPLGGNAKTMLLNTQAYYTKDDGNVVNDIQEYEGIEYICIRRYPNSAGELNTYQSYSISNNWANSCTNNTVRCEVSIDGVKYSASNMMRFGKSGTNGKNTTLVLEMFNNHNAIIVPNPQENGKNIRYRVIATLYDANHEKLPITTGTWEWNWKTPMVKWKKNNEDLEAVILIPDENNPNQIELETTLENLNDLKNGYYGILQVSFHQLNQTTLTTYMNIPLKQATYSHIEGGQEITYSASGAPSYDSEAYKLFSINPTTGFFDEHLDVEWKINHNIDVYVKGQPEYREVSTNNWVDANNKKVDSDGYLLNAIGERIVSGMTESYIPKLNDVYKVGHTYKALSPATFYAENYDEICVKCQSTINGEYKQINNVTEDDFEKDIYYICTGNNEYIMATEYKNDETYYQFDGEVLWIQPLLITSSQYDYSVLNNWDNTLVTDNGNGTVMATLIGAGRKNDDNTFSGILMGEVQDADDINNGANFTAIEDLSRSDFNDGTYYEYDGDTKKYFISSDYSSEKTYYKLKPSTGLYGFQNGLISFSLKDTGIATFGRAGRGQIIIDGNSSTITSGGYASDGSGMFLDLDDGQLIIQDADMTKFTLQAADPYLTISGTSNASEPMIQIGGEECYLQSRLRSRGGKGAKLDLVEGIFDIKGTGGNVLISGRAQDPFFRVTTPEGAPLIHMDTDGYYLQSHIFEPEDNPRVTNDNFKLKLYQEKEYIPIAMNPDLYKEKQNTDGTYRYFIKKNGSYENADDDFNWNTQYYRKGNRNNVYAYDDKHGILYTTIATENKNFIVNSAIDYYANDGEYLFIIRQSLKYESTGDSNNPYIEVVNDYQDDPKTGLSVYIERFLEIIPSDITPQGMRLDLLHGRIEGYNLKLIGTKIKDNKVKNRLIINTGDSTTPLKIGNNFYVKWDGEMGCTRVKYLAYTSKPLENLSADGVYTAGTEVTHYLDLENGTFTGKADYATTAGSLADSKFDDFYDDFYDGEGKSKYVKKTDTTYTSMINMLFGSSPGDEDNLDTRVRNLENASGNYVQEEDADYQAIKRIIFGTSNFDTDDLETKISSLEDIINNLKERIEALENPMA